MNGKRMSVSIRLMSVGIGFMLLSGCAGGGSTAPTGTRSVADAPVAAKRENVSRFGTDRVRVPLELRGGALYIRGTVNGKPVLLIVDTGASSTVFDRAAVARLGLPTRATGMRSVGIGMHSVEMRQLPLIAMNVVSGDAGADRIGPGFALSMSPTQIDLSTMVSNKLSRGMEAPSGLLGLDVLRAYDAIIDTREGAMYLVRK
jgi:hypothetical protein